MARKNRRKIKNLLGNLTLLFISLVVSFLALEIFFRFYLGSNLHYTYTNDTLWELKPNQRGFTYPNNKYATINSYGIRGPLPERNSSKPTVVILGDSVAFGYSIGDNDTIASNLRRIHPDMQFINGAVPGYGIYQMIELYKKKFDSLNPDAVILMIIEGDIFRQPAAFDKYYYRKMAARKLIRSSSFIAFVKPRLNNLRAIIEGDSKVKNELYDTYLKIDQERIKNFSKYLSKRGVDLLVFPFIFDSSQERFYALMKNFGEENNITVLPDFYPVIESYPGGYKSLKSEDSHPSEKLTKMIASFLSKNFINNTCVRCH